ncbi:hypothetical protein [Methylomagnum ishizawai]|uniref:hypothetical protein n=1 Tax=Methylomagnum ishizawai TaxID=1760988 RepID=UPI001C811A9A|nr:hypothetical protein [Methylomagnum ishizawai]
MKAKFPRQTIGAMAALLILAGLPQLVSAHDQVGFLRKKATATDIYRVGCPVDPAAGTPDRLDIAIRTAKAVPFLLTAQVQRDAQSTSTTDPKSGDKRFSSTVSLYAGSGDYTVTVAKTPKSGKKSKKLNALVSYTLQFHCYGTQHTDTHIETLQDQ